MVSPHRGGNFSMHSNSFMANPSLGIAGDAYGADKMEPIAVFTTCGITQCASTNPNPIEIPNTNIPK